MTPDRHRISERDRQLLEALAEHRIAVLDQCAVWLEVTPRTAGRRLSRLVIAGLVEYGRIFDAGAPAVRITSAGLRAVGSSRGAPGRKLDEYRHDVGVGWIWTAARVGAFGELRAIHSERGLRSHDTRLDRLSERGAAGAGGPEDLLAVGRGLWGPRGTLERHYPDLLLEGAGGHRIAVELELSIKGRAALDRVMEAYRSDRRVDAVLYLAGDPRIAQRIRDAAARWGLEDRIAVRLVAGAVIGGVPTPSPTTRRLARSRPATHTVVGGDRGSPPFGRAMGGLGR